MVFLELCAKIRVLFIALVGLIRRAMCCFPRRRKSSVGESENLQCVNVVRENYGRNRQDKERDWNSWDDSPRTVEEHIEQYRQKLTSPPTPKLEEPDLDFFTDMTPKINPQKKYFLGNSKEEKTDFSRLEAKIDVPIAINADLEDWAEEDPGGWDELDTETTKQLIREKRKELRNERQNANKAKGISSPQHLMFAEKINSHSRHS